MRTQIDQEKDKGMKTFMSNMTRQWYVFVLSVIVFLLLAFLYLRYTTPQYMISGVMMLKDQKNMPETIHCALQFLSKSPPQLEKPGAAIQPLLCIPAFQLR